MDELYVLAGWSLFIILIIVIGIYLHKDYKEEQAQKQKIAKEEEAFARVQKLKNMGAITEKEYELEKYRIRYNNK